MPNKDIVKTCMNSIRVLYQMINLNISTQQ